MDNYCAVQLSSCVKGELILLKANMPYLYAYVLDDAFLYLSDDMLNYS